MTAGHSIDFVFGDDDLLRTRFAVSPLIELVAATYVLRQPRRFPAHRRWAESAGACVSGLRLDLLFAVNPLGRTAWPNFNAPPPVHPSPRIEDELARVRSSELDVVRSDVLRAHPDGVPPAARPFLDDTGPALAELVAQMSAFWTAAVEPWWPRMSAFLESEIAGRARRLVTTGGVAAFADLDPTTTWDGRTLSVAADRMGPQTVRLDGRGLLLLPSVLAFGAWPRTAAPWDPALTYQPPGIGDVWSTGTGSEHALADLFGRRRATLLQSLDRPASTTALARRTGWSAGAVSTHLGVLWRAGLVTRRRDGRVVRYSRTATGDALTASTRPVPSG